MEPIRVNCPIHFCDFDIRSGASVENRTPLKPVPIIGRWVTHKTVGVSFEETHPQFVIVIVMIIMYFRESIGLTLNYLLG